MLLKHLLNFLDVSKSRTIHCWLMLVHSALTNVNKHNFVLGFKMYL